MPGVPSGGEGNGEGSGWSMKVLQLNLNHCEAAQDLLAQTVRDLEIDVAIISEQHRDNGNPATWIPDGTSKAAIWVCGRTFIEGTPRAASAGFTWAKLEGVYVYSVYAPPSETQAEFEKMLNDLAEDARGRRPHVIAGDFNAWATEWGSRETNRRGEALLDFAASLDAVLLNTGTAPTFTRNGNSSIIDVTFASESLSPRVTSWRVSGHYTHSDHQAIVLEIAAEGGRGRAKPPAPARWNARSLDGEAFRTMMLGDVQLAGSAEHMASQLMTLVTDACDAAMTRCSGKSRHAPVYWWTEEIAELRRQCHRTRRQAQRARHREDFEGMRLRHHEARGALKRAIKTSKRRTWRELCDAVDGDPWGRPYTTVMSRLKSSATAPPSCPALLERIVDTLFPDQLELVYSEDRPADRRSDAPAITERELLNACSRIGDSKAPGPDGVPNVALKAAIRSRPEVFIRTYDACLAEGVFPSRWKKQRLVLLPKGNKPPDDPSSYRPICLLDTAGKVLERIIYNRLEQCTEGTRGLSPSQYGFRKARSTVDAIHVVVDAARQAIAGKRWKYGAKQYCAIVTLDVRNAFNSANWDCILVALRRMAVPEYVRRVILSYFSERALTYNTDAGPKSRDISGGVPQGSVLGPILWNVMYDGVLRLPLPTGTTTVGFADDVAVVVVAKHLEEITERANQAIRAIRGWLAENGLQLADHKTEAVLVTSRKVRETITLRVGGCEICSQPSLRYLGVQLDARLRFDDHLRIVSAKAGAVCNALARIMPNIGGPRQARRKLLSTVVTSVMLYAAPIWSAAAAVPSYVRQMTSVYRRSALRVARAFRTVSYEAACVVATMTPIHLLAEERALVYQRRREDPAADRRAIDEEAKMTTTEQWQRLWAGSTKGRWTHRLIPDIAAWTARDHGEVDYYLSQLLTGHGAFRAYRHRFGLEDVAVCPTCQSTPEDAEHVFFSCTRFGEEREILQGHLRQQLSPETITSEMMASPTTWDATSTFVAGVIRKLRQAEKLRRG